MFKIFLALSSAVVAVATVPALAQTTLSEPSATAQLGAIAASAKAGDCAAALTQIDQIKTSPNFIALSPSTRLGAYETGADCARKTKRFDDMLAYAEAGTLLPGASNNLWQLRLMKEVQNLLTLPHRRAEDDARVVASVESMSATAPQALNNITAMPVAELNRHLRQAGEVDLRRRLLTILTAPRYVPGWPGESADPFRADYALMLADAGDEKSAAAIVDSIELPTARIRLSLDPRLRSSTAKDFDAKVLVEKHITAMSKIAAGARRALLPLYEIASDYQMLGRADAMLSVLQQVNPDAAMPSAFIDFHGRMNWWWDKTAVAYALLGRYDEMVAAMKNGIAAGENGRPENISQTINLAGLQVRFGHPADALTTLANTSAMISRGSSIGRMEWREAHGCASFAVGNHRQAEADLAYMKDHAGDDINALFEAQMCIGDADGAAATMIRRLDIADERTSALLILSDHAPWPQTYPVAPWETGLDVLKRRSDIQAAISRVGGVRKFNIAMPH